MRLRGPRSFDWVGIAVLIAALWLATRGFIDVLEDLV